MQLLLDGSDPLTLKEIGEQIGLTRERVRQIESRALDKLRRAMVRFNAEPSLSKIRARVLYVISRSDVLFPPSIAPALAIFQIGISACS